MSKNIRDLGIDLLSVPEKLDLIEQIWESIPIGVQTAELPDWHRVILEQRRAEMSISTPLGKPWREAMSRFEGRKT